MSPQYGELRPTSGWDHFVSLGHPCKFQRVSSLGSDTARHSSSGRQPNFAALNRGRHLYSAGRPSRWALAHNSSFYWKFVDFLHFFSTTTQGIRLRRVDFFDDVVVVHDVYYKRTALGARHKVNPNRYLWLSFVRSNDFHLWSHVLVTPRYHCHCTTHPCGTIWM